MKREFDVFPWGKPEWIDYYSQKRELTATKTSYQKEVHSQVLQDVIKRVELKLSKIGIDVGLKSWFKEQKAEVLYPRTVGN